MVPPLLPAQVQSHGPLPFTAEAAPVEHKFLVGFALIATPFAEPHDPLISSWAAQLAAEPPFEPAQLQFQGPVPLTAEAAPALQRPVVGTLVRSAPFDVPQLPLTAAGRSGAEQLAVVPPLLPAQLQLHGPLPLTAEAIPAEHKLLVGALVTATPLAEPQAPLPAEALSLSKWMPVMALLANTR